MAKRSGQDKDLFFALDIGTRSIIGVVGRVEDERFQVLAIEKEEHGKRAMLDGQIEDIGQVAKVARRVTDRLEERLDCTLERVCVAAAGRALRTEKGSYTLEFPEVTHVTTALAAWRAARWPQRRLRWDWVRTAAAGSIWWAIPSPAISLTTTP